MSRKIKFSDGEYYHIYNRGVDRRVIFIDKNDYDRFLFLLEVCNNIKPIEIRRCGGETSVEERDKIVNIGAYCLMPNHFHILIREKNEGGISKYIQKVSTAYTMYFNKKYSRSGSLLQGVFQAKHTNTDEYLKYLYSYIHLNPIKLIQPDWKSKGINNVSEAFNFLKGYRYSSYIDYIQENNTDKILDKGYFPEYFKTKTDFNENLLSWLNFGGGETSAGEAPPRGSYPQIN